MMTGFDFPSIWKWFRDRPLVALPASLALVSFLLFALPLKADTPSGLPPRQEPSLSFSCKTVPQEEPLARTTRGRPTNFFFVEDQVILFGPREQVDRTIQEMELNLLQLREGFDLRLNRDCTLRFPRTVSKDSQLDLAYFPFTAAEQENLVLQLYDIDFQSPLTLRDQANPVVEVIRFVNQESGVPNVFADPNYITGTLGASQCGSPHEPGGSPFEAYATHHERGRSRRPDESGGEHQPPPGPAGSPLVGDYPTAKANEFWDQWALEHIGLGPFSEYTLGANPDAPTGAGVHVAVFDTSPFTPGLKYEEAIASGEPVYYNSDPQLIDWPNRSGYTETFTLKLAFSNDERLEEVQSGVAATATNVVDHGLFVSSLVHAIAPNSRVELVRVLNDYGCGDLQTLNESLIDFVVKQDKERLGLDGVVMNLSLGIQKPRSLHGLVGKDKQINLAGLSIDDLETLAGVMSVAQSRGGILVAATGNDSTQTRALPMHLPADYPFVVGVAASTIDRKRACFSNWGDIAAPGGDGQPSANNPVDRPCLPAHSAAVDSDITAPGTRDVADASLIGLAWHLPDSQAGGSPPPYYRYWSGTSFSAPLVSGLAALVLDAGFDDAGWMAPDQVFETIRCGSPPPDGVINVPATLFRCIP